MKINVVKTEKKLFSNVHWLNEKDDIITKYDEMLQLLNSYLVYMYEEYGRFSGDIIKFTVNISYKIKKIIQYYLESNYKCAIREMRKVLFYYESLDSEFINTLENGMKRCAYNEREYTESKSIADSPLYSRFFKARFGEIISDFTYKSMYHIPLSKRYLVKNYRFNMNGNPCLYLGTSSLCCFNELKGVPDYNFYLSSYQLSKELKFIYLNFSYFDYLKSFESDTKYLQERLSIKTDEFYQNQYKLCLYKFDLNNIKKNLKNEDELILFLPLLIATSFKYKNSENRIFREDYIFSQLLMNEVTRTDKVDGIFYFSCETNSILMEVVDLYNPAILNTNVALPILKRIKKKYLPNYLDDKIKISEPISFSYFKNINYMLNNNYYISYNKIYLGAWVNYDDTDFYKFDNWTIDKKIYNDKNFHKLEFYKKI